MKKNSKSLAFTVTLVLLSLFLNLLTGCNNGTQTMENKTRKTNSGQYVSTHPSFVTKQELNSILASSSKGELKAEGKIVSAVMPHHLVAGRLIANAMEVIAKQKPTLLILIGPNHNNQGGKIITGFSGWQTPEGIVQVEDTVVKFLIDHGLALRNEDILSREHSIGALVPLVKHYLPEANVVPIVFHHGVGLQEVDNLLNALEPFLDQKAVLISSVDFSHYLTRSEAQLKDSETIRYMRNFDYPTLFKLGDDYLDSPASLAAAFRLAEKRGLKDIRILDNTNSGIILQNDFIETTSYFTLLFESPFSTTYIDLLRIYPAVFHRSRRTV